MSVASVTPINQPIDETAIADWLGKQLKRTNPRYEVLLLHRCLPSGTVEKEALAAPLALSEDEDAVQIAQMVWKVCCSNAAAYQGPQRYKIILGAGALRVQFPFRIDPDPVDEVEEGERSPMPQNDGSLQAQLKQQMEFSQKAMGMVHSQMTMVMGHMQTILENYATDNKAQRQIIQELSRQLTRRGEDDKSERQVESVLSTELDMIREERRAEAARQEKLWDKIGMMAPAILGRVVGGEEGARQLAAMTGTSPALEQVKGFMQSIRPDQFDRIGEILDETQRLGLAELITQGAAPSK